MSHSLIFALLPLLVILADVKKLSIELRVFKILRFELIKLHKFVVASFGLVVRLFLLLDKQNESGFDWLDKLERNTLGQKPKRYDFVHPGLVVDLNSCVFISHGDKTSTIGSDRLEESRDTQIGVEVLGLSGS